MMFGLVDSLEKIDFTLPADTAGTLQTLANSKPQGDLQVFLGASKWSIKEWYGLLYPLRPWTTDVLNVYARNFNTVEFLPTYYRHYDVQEIKAWAEKVAESPEFKFLPKFPQMITHIAG